MGSNVDQQYENDIKDLERHSVYDYLYLYCKGDPLYIKRQKNNMFDAVVHTHASRIIPDCHLIFKRLFNTLGPADHIFVLLIRDYMWGICACARNREIWDKKQYETIFRMTINTDKILNYWDDYLKYELAKIVEDGIIEMDIRKHDLKHMWI